MITSSITALGRALRLLTLFLVVTALAGCGNDTDEPAPNSLPTPPEDEQALPGGVTQVRTFTADDITYGAVDRSFLLHLPDGIDEDRAYPLVFVFHGNGGDAYSTESRSRFSDASDENGFIAVYPQGLGVPRNTDTDIQSTIPGTQNAPAGWNTRPAATSYGAVNDVDDEGFITQVLIRLKGELAIDEARVYSTGLSNGCGFTTVLMARNEAIAATAQNACGMYPVDVFPLNFRKIPFMVLHGTEDDVVPYDGSAGTAVPGGRTPLPQVMSDWADFYECESKRTTTQDNVERWDYEGCAADISFITIHGGEHQWYPWQAQMIWDFFTQHPQASAD